MSFSQAPLGEVRRKRFCNRTKFLMIKDIQSRPTRARGLKPVALGHGIRGPSSRPTRARGLKRSLCGISIARSPSRPTRARGLKHVGLERGGTLIGVAPHAGAWIETRPHTPNWAGGMPSRPTRARGLKRAYRLAGQGYGQSRPTRARGLKRLPAH